jgi:predicted nucleic acid-binding protein
MVVLDSTFLIHLLLERKNARKKAESLPDKITTTRINVFEVLIGIYSNSDSEKALQIFNELVDSIEVLELDSDSANRAALLAAELNKKGETVAYNDILIAAIAMENGEDTIITQNMRDFSRIRGMNAQNY